MTAPLSNPRRRGAAKLLIRPLEPRVLHALKRLVQLGVSATTRMQPLTHAEQMAVNALEEPRRMLVGQDVGVRLLECMDDATGRGLLVKGRPRVGDLLLQEMHKEGPVWRPTPGRTFRVSRHALPALESAIASWLSSTADTVEVRNG